MSNTQQHLTWGIALYGDLRDLLQIERVALVAHEAAEIDDANNRQEAILEEITQWEKESRDLLAEPEGTSAVDTFGEMVKSWSGTARVQGEKLVSDLRETIEEARHLAAVNHILVERNLAMVSRTLDFYTGGKSKNTYDSQGAMADDRRYGMVTRKG